MSAYIANALCQSLGDGKIQVVGYHLPGDVCGLSWIGCNLRDYHIRSLVPSVTAPIPAAVLTNLASHSPAVGRALLRQMSVEAAISRQWITNLGQRSASLRIGHLACEFGRRLDAIGLVENNSFQWFGTQNDLRAATGLSLVHVKPETAPGAAERSAGDAGIARDPSEVKSQQANASKASPGTVGAAPGADTKSQGK